MVLAKAGESDKEKDIREPVDTCGSVDLYFIITVL